MRLVHEALRIASALPPPPEPDARPTRDPDQAILLFAGGLVVVAFLAVVGLLRARSRPARRVGSPAPPAYRLEHWRDGIAEIVACGEGPASMDVALALHAARLQAEGAAGALVLIEQASDAIVALRPVRPEESRPPPPARPAGTPPMPRVGVATRADIAP
jgi:hypothetical protein